LAFEINITRNTTLMKKFIIILAYLFFLTNTTFGQDLQDETEKPQSILQITGRLTDKQSKEPIPFANVGVMGTYIGAATNMDGYFQVKIPARYKDRNLQISAVGYSTFKSPVTDCLIPDSLIVELIPMNYKIGEIEVKAQSLVLIKTLKNAIDNISKNYLQQPFTYDVYYRSEKWNNDSLSRLREAAVKIFDAKGYQRNDVYKVFKERGYRFQQVRKNFESSSLADGSSYLDDLLEMDLVRVRGNILNKNHLNYYSLKLEKVTQYENDSIWVIAYKSRRPTASNTGDSYAKSYEGKIYIKMTDYAIVKNETHVTATNYSPQGRSFYVNEKKQTWKPEKIEYDFSATYKKHQDYYYLSYVNYNRHHKLINKKSGTHKKLDIHTEMLITSINTTDPTPIKKRAYYENIPYDKKFWESYNIIFDGEQ